MAATYRLTVDGIEREVEITERAGALAVRMDGETLPADIRWITGPLYSLLLDGRSYEVVAVDRGTGYEVLIGNQGFEVEVERPGARGAAARGGRPSRAAGDLVRSPMTGVVVEVAIRPNDEVQMGQVVVVVESMKMNNELRAPRDGRVAQVHVGKGDRVERNAVLVTLA